MKLKPNPALVKYNKAMADYKYEAEIAYSAIVRKFEADVAKLQDKRKKIMERINADFNKDIKAVNNGTFKYNLRMMKTTAK